VHDLAIGGNGTRSGPVVRIVQVQQHTEHAQIRDLLDVLPVVVNQRHSSQLLAHIALLSAYAISIRVTVQNASEYAREVSLQPSSSNGLQRRLSARDNMEFVMTSAMQLTQHLQTYRVSH